MPRGGATKHENHPLLNPLPSRERNSLFPPLVGGMKGRGVFVVMTICGEIRLFTILAKLALINIICKGFLLDDQNDCFPSFSPAIVVYDLARV
jgi:hypothetical protein